MRSTAVAEPRRARVAAVFSLFFGATLAAVAVLLTGDGALAGSLRAVDPLLLVAGLLFAFLVLRFSAAGLPILIALVYLNLSHALVRYHEFPSLLQLLVVVLAFAAWLRRDTVPLHELVRDPLAVALLASVLYAFVTTAFAADRAVADERVVELTKALVIYALVTLLVRNRRRLIQAFAVLIASAAFLSALPILQTLTGNFHWRFGGLARIKQAHIYGNVFEARIAGPIGDPNFFAQVLLLVLPLPLVMAATFESRRKRLACLGAAAVILAAILLTYSRGAMLALAVMAVLLVRALHISWRKTAGGAAAGLALILLLPAAVTERFLTIEQILPTADAPLRPDSSFQERRLLMRVAWVMFADNAIRGVGAGNYTARYDDYVDETGSEARQYAGASDLYFPHNLFLEIAAETGLLGLAIFAVIIVAAFAALAGAHSRLAAAGDPLLQRAAMAMVIGLTGFLVAGLFLHLAFPRYLFLFLALTSAIRRVASAGPEPVEAELLPVPAEAIEPAGAVAPSARLPVAVLVSRFPLITETFILREITELERQGQPVVLVPMIEENPAVVHQEAVPWRDRAVYTPWLSWKVARAFLAAMARQPATMLRLIGWIIGDSFLRPATLFKSLAVLPKSAYLASILPAHGVSHLHA
ncbi:MAG TPA: O-antigen ligase family protein, partial [Thermoanaerobaculia bacterium]|nr:O-antigen ligase family protein [Thermoanaerobaculia bacterium]